MKEQFVTYEIALKLGELGFNEKCFGYYYCKSNIHIGDNCYSFTNGYITKTYVENVCQSDDAFLAPLWQQAIDWFRNNNILIEILATDDWDHWIFQIWGKDMSAPFYHMYESDENKSYEEAREQSILKAIELIQKL